MRLLIFKSFFVLSLFFIWTKANAQTEPFPHPVDTFQQEIQQNNSWFQSNSNQYAFSNWRIQSGLKDLKAGEDILSDTMLTDLLTNYGITGTGTTYTIPDTSYFLEHGNHFTRFSNFKVEKKLNQSIQLNNVSNASTNLYRIHEITEVWSDNPIMDSPWHIEVYYYALSDQSSHITSSLSYWHEQVYNLESSIKVIQDGQTNILYRQSPASDLELVMKPVPANDQLSISLSTESNIDGLNLGIYTLQGTSVMNKNLGALSNKESKTFQLNVSTIPAGSYLLRLTNKSLTIVRKFSILR